MNISDIVKLLAREYGDLNWYSHREPLAELILTILSQNTSDHNSRRAFSSLISTFGSLHAIADADVESIAQAIKIGGLARVKAPRIKRIIEQILAERGSLDLSFLAGLPIDEAKAWLRRLPGVGPKTVGCVLLFSLGKPVLPVDTHVYRVARRLGLIGAKVSAERAHEILGSVVPDEDVYRFHIYLIQHGRSVCKAQSLHCAQCALREDCPTGRLLLKPRLKEAKR
ncbi:endonuclease III domain-containing protein [Chloroflexota bacterium]